MGNLTTTASVAAGLLRAVAVIVPCLAVGFGATSAVACTTKVMVVTPTPTNQPRTPTVTPRPTATATPGTESFTPRSFITEVLDAGKAGLSKPRELDRRFVSNSDAKAEGFDPDAWGRVLAGYAAFQEGDFAGSRIFQLVVTAAVYKDRHGPASQLDSIDVSDASSLPCCQQTWGPFTVKLLSAEKLSVLNFGDRTEAVRMKTTATSQGGETGLIYVDSIVVALDNTTVGLMILTPDRALASDDMSRLLTSFVRTARRLVSRLETGCCSD